MQVEEMIKCLASVQQVDPEMPLAQLQCLLVIAKEKEISLTDLAKKSNIGLATASRYVASLGKINRYKEEGLNFVEAYEDPMERRKKIIRLTTKGKLLVKKLLGDQNADI